MTYNIESLLQYIVSSNDLRDPVSRCPYTQDDLTQLDQACTQLGLHPISSLQLADDYEHDKKNLRLGLETVCGEMVYEMLSIIECRYSQLYCDTRFGVIFSQFIPQFDELKELDLESAYLLTLAWGSFVRGSPKKPTKDNHGKMRIVLDFLTCKLYYICTHIYLLYDYVSLIFFVLYYVIALCTDAEKARVLSLRG